MGGHGHGLVIWGFLRPARKHKNKNANKENGVILMSRACNVEMYDGVTIKLFGCA